MSRPPRPFHAPRNQATREWNPERDPHLPRRVRPGKARPHPRELIRVCASPPAPAVAWRLSMKLARPVALALSVAATACTATLPGEATLSGGLPDPCGPDLIAHWAFDDPPGNAV